MSCYSSSFHIVPPHAYAMQSFLNAFIHLYFQHSMSFYNNDIHDYIHQSTVQSFRHTRHSFGIYNNDKRKIIHASSNQSKVIKTINSFIYSIILIVVQDLIA